MGLRAVRILASACFVLLTPTFADCAPLRVAIIGLVHGHAAGFLGGSALVPAGGLAKRSDVQIVGIAEPDRSLFDRYAKHFHFAPDLYFSNTAAMLEKVHPDAALVFTDTLGHTAAVKECAAHHVNVLMEKPLAVSYSDALQMASAARSSGIHVLVDYETTWYASNKAVHDLLQQSALGQIRKVIVRDGHAGPQKIHVSPEFFHWLTDPDLNGAGALYDFGCYGADLMTWFMKGETPISVSAIALHLQPDVYPKVEDEADVLLQYKSAVAILQGSWNWPFNIKDMDVYGSTGLAKTVESGRIKTRKENAPAEVESSATPIAPPYDDPIHYLAAILNGSIQENGDLSSLQTNVVVSEILDAARQSIRTGRSVRLPLPH
jgi:glucose-fructose oxidoreductase